MGSSGTDAPPLFALQWPMHRRGLCAALQSFFWGDLLSCACSCRPCQYRSSSLSRGRPCLPTQDVSEECSMASKPLIGVTADYRSARKETPAFSFLRRGITMPSASRCGARGYSAFAGGRGSKPRAGRPGWRRALRRRRSRSANDGFMLHPAVRLLDRAARTSIAC